MPVIYSTKFQLYVPIQQLFFKQQNNRAMKAMDTDSHIGVKKELKTSEGGRKVRQNFGLTSIQQPLKSLLYRNRSLRSLFEGTSSKLQIGRTQKHKNDGFNAKNELVIKRIANLNGSKANKQKQKSITKDYYLIGFKKQNQNELRDRLKQFRKKEEMERFKMIAHQKNKVSYFMDTNKNPLSKSYDPQSYNWRKSLKKEKMQTTLQDNFSSLQFSKMLSSEYYDCNTQQSGKSDKQKKTKNQKKISSLFQKKEIRSTSLSSKPKVVKNVFDLRSPRAKCEPFAPQKSLQFTFGI